MDFFTCMIDGMKGKDPAEEFSLLYAEVYQYCYRRSSPRDFRISLESYQLLQHLNVSGPLAINEAARHFDRSQSTMSEMFARLIQRDILAKVVDGRDKRRHLVWITETGHEVLERYNRPLSGELLANAMSRITKTNQTQLVRCMRDLARAAKDCANGTNIK